MARQDVAATSLLVLLAASLASTALAQGPYVSTQAPERERERVLACVSPEGRYGGFSCEGVAMELRVRMAYLHCLRDLQGCPRDLLSDELRQDVDFRACVAAIEQARGEAPCDTSHLDDAARARLAQAAADVIAADEAARLERERQQRAREAAERADNFERCLAADGVASRTCDPTLLDDSQRQRIKEAVAAARLRECLRRPEACDEKQLPPPSRARVAETRRQRQQAARRAAEEAKAREARIRVERNRNFANCATHSGPCNIELLTLEQLARLVEIDQNRRSGR